MMKSYVLNGYHQSFLKKKITKKVETKPDFFLEKEAVFLKEKKTLNVGNEKTFGSQ